MLHWFSPFPLPEWAVAQLEQNGLEPLGELPAELQEPVLLLYDTPDRLLATSLMSGADLLAGYSALRESPLPWPRLALWRLQPLSPEELKACLGDASPSENIAAVLWPDPDPLAALVAGSLCQAVPGLLDAYLDLELQAELAGGEPDSRYLRRLQGHLEPGALLQAWRSPGVLDAELEDIRQQLSSKDAALAEAREEAELTLLQLHQIQVELEQIFLADREKQQLLEAKGKELEELRRQLVEKETALKGINQQLEAKEKELEELRRQVGENEKALKGINQQLEAQGKEFGELRRRLGEKEKALTDAREEAELTLLQLHQVQEELEHYFLLSRGQQKLLERHDELEQRSERLLVSLRRRG